MNILVTGTAGFIGFHMTQRLIDSGHTVLGLDAITSYYDVRLKYNRLAELGFENQETAVWNHRCASSNYPTRSFFQRTWVQDEAQMLKVFADFKPDYVIHLAAQAGLKNVYEAPETYIDNNVKATYQLLECCRRFPVKHVLFASSSSVYGLETEMPLHEEMACNKPASLYGASKKACEEISFSYAHLFKLRVSALRFFTVYGPWGRPDMVVGLFAHALSNNETLQLRNGGEMWRDFTFVADITKAIELLMVSENSSKDTPWEVYNIGKGTPVKVMDMLITLESLTGKSANTISVKALDAELHRNDANVSKLLQKTGYSPETNIYDGLQQYIQWYTPYAAIHA